MARLRPEPAMREEGMTSLEVREPAVGRRAPAAGFSRYARRHAMQIGTLAVGLLVWLIFVAGAPRTFLSLNIYQAFMSTTPFFALMALPLTMVVIAGEIDLSFPSIMALGMTAYALTLVYTSNLLLAFVACGLAGILAGFVNGVIVAGLGIPSLVATIGTQFFWRGVVLVTTGGNGVSLVPTRGTAFYSTMVGRLAGVIPAQMLWTIAMAVAVAFLLNRHRFGAHTYLIGDNIESARLMGVNVRQRKMLLFVIMGFAAAFAGLLASLEVTYFWPTLGDGYLLTTIASVFLGGTSVFGGTGSVAGTFVACFIIGAINAGIVAIGLTGFWTQLIYGLIIVVSVTLQTVLIRKLA
jgi:simple sugar transport system permease protein